MDKNNSELFSQAISEGLSKRFDNIANGYTEEIIYSDKHMLAIRTIVYGKSNAGRGWSPRMKRIIAILVAVALLLTSCSIIFRNEIREIFKDLFVSLTYDDDNNYSNDEITEIYLLSYLPEGFYLKDSIINSSVAHYIYTNDMGDELFFDQQPVKGTYYIVDSENGYSKINILESYEIYYRFTNKNHHYIWKDDKYTLKIKTNVKISNEEMILIIKGITKK